MIWGQTSLLKSHEAGESRVARRANNHGVSGGDGIRKDVDVTSRNAHEFCESTITPDADISSVHNNAITRCDVGNARSNNGAGTVHAANQAGRATNSAVRFNDHCVFVVDTAPLNGNGDVVPIGSREISSDVSGEVGITRGYEECSHIPRLEGRYNQPVEQRAFIDWTSPFTPQQATAGVPTYSAVRKWGKGIGVLRNTGERGSAQLWSFRKGEWRAISDVTEKVTSGLYGYGGPAWTPFGSRRALCLLPARGVVQMYDDRGHALHSFPLEGAQQGFPVRWSKNEFAYIADYGPEVGRAVIVVDTASGLSRTVWRTADFIGGLTADVHSGRVAWHAWPSGSMPWDSAQVWIADRTYTQLHPQAVAGSAGHAAMNPTWIHGQLYFQVEADGYFRPVRRSTDGTQVAVVLGGESLSDWFFGWPWTVGVGANTAHVTIRSSTTFVHVWRTDGSVELLDSAPVGIQEVAGDETSLWVTGSDHAKGSSLWQYQLQKKRWRLVSSVSPGFLRADEVSVSELRRTDSGVPFVYFEPSHPTLFAPTEDRPGLIIDVHGGPTAYAKRGLRATTQLFAKSGFAFASVDYRGSVGYGASYRRSLNGHYGEFDVEDIRSVARYLLERGEVDPNRVFVRGGSSGGMTALLAAEDSIFAGAIAHYPVTDTRRLNEATHEVEGRYLEELIGPLPDNLHKFNSISPQFRTQFPRKVMITHGAEDHVIPVQLVRDYVAKLQEAGVIVNYLEFAGEGHGYRSLEVQAQVLSAEQAFLRS